MVEELAAVFAVPIEARDPASMRRKHVRIDTLPTVTISLSSLALDEFTRQDGEYNEHTPALSELGEQQPPIVVHGPSMQVIDGIHRVRAAFMRGDKTIAAKIYQGAYYDDAALMMVRMNIAHGLP
jgi:ParB-like chromosome segregation protein Spo0J